jgi:YD repeat-containing protein
LSVVDYVNMPDTTFTYDDDGRKIAMVDGTGQTSWFYNSASQLTSLNQAGKLTSYTYNLDGSRASMAQPAGTTQYSYDTYGRPTGLVNPFAEATSFIYDSQSRVIQKSLSSGTKEDYAYDSLDRLSTMQVKNSAGTVTRSEGYTYNGFNEVVSHTEDGVTTTYAYDNLSQLTSEFRPGYSASY